MQAIECKICKEQFKKEWLLKKHITQKHKEITVAQYIVDTKYNGNWPTCKCGCRNKLTYFPGKKGFGEYLVGHKMNIKNNFNTEESKKKSAKTRKERFKIGKIKVWNDGVKQTDNTKYGKILRESTIKMNTKERGEKISKKLKGIPKSKEVMENLWKKNKEYWDNPLHRQEQRLRTIKHLREKLFNQPTDIELIMAEILDSLGIQFEPQYALGGYLFDFWIKDTNILLETDGNFWHCKSGKPKYDAQKNKIRIDKQKNEWAQKNGYNLIRFWESDIKDSRLDVIQKLITEIKK